MAQPNWFRRCVGCGKARHKKELLRIVQSLNGQFEIDWQQKKPGRGAYICLNLECAILAKKKRGFHRSFQVDVPSSFYDDLIRALRPALAE